MLMLNTLRVFFVDVLERFKNGPTVPALYTMAKHTWIPYHDTLPSHPLEGHSQTAAQSWKHKCLGCTFMLQHLDIPLLELRAPNLF